MWDAERPGTEGLTGGFLCGAVRYRTNGPPKRVGVCHCPTCKRQTGSPLPAFAIFAADAVTVTGETRGFRTSPNGERRFCPACGSPVYGDEGDEYAVSVGKLDDTAAVAPTYALRSERRSGGKESGRTSGSRRVPAHQKINTT